MDQNHSNLNELLNNPQAAALLNDRTAMQQILNSEDVKNLLTRLTRSGSAELQTAVSAGDTEALKRMIQSVLRTDEGKKLAERIRKSYNGRTR